ncbi:hypothetical protein POM88_027674 [Heracleum sosnowskyi]|uniref:Uncharacterized protein n=1 Tax=Heracleum sosnowskyi TaxID=360622 RepID=A0AAD8I8U5_9APIA|nr:hypothetical protein POM88_027674 [Heracleum sosnowskyi]
MMRTVLPTLAQAVARSSSAEGSTENTKQQFQGFIAFSGFAASLYVAARVRQEDADKDDWFIVKGPTVCPIFCKPDGKTTAEYYAIVICVPKKLLYKSVQQLRDSVPVLLLCANLYYGGTLMDQVMNLQFSYWQIFRCLNFMPSFLAGLRKDCAICTGTTDSTAVFLAACATQIGKSVRYLSK